MKIYIFRHGQTDFNRDGKFTGWLDSKLTELGIKQAKTIAEKLKGVKFTVAFHTSLSRSKETLDEILRYHPECIRKIEDDRMIERNYGDLNGMTHTEFINSNGQDEFARIHRGYSTPPPGGESFAMVEERVTSFIKDLKELMKKDRVNVAISAHGNSIRLFRKIMENASESDTVSWVIPFDSYYEYDVEN